MPDGADGHPGMLQFQIVGQARVVNRDSARGLHSDRNQRIQTRGGVAAEP